MFEALARERPAVLVFEDIHWAEPPLLDLIDHVAEWSRSSPFLLVATARPDLLDQRPSWGGGKTNSTTIQLEPLAADACGRLISALHPDRQLAEAEQQKLIAAAEGNPLFLEQMVAMLDTAGSDELVVPPSISALLAARLDQLSAGDRRVVEAASVEGREFHRSALLALLPDSEQAGLEECLRRLVRELIDPDESQFRADDAYRFQHQLIRDAAYHGVSNRDRAAHHEALAGWIERTAGERADEYAEIVAYHLSEAVRYGRELGQPGGPLDALSLRAATLYRLAADRAVARGDLAAASALVTHLGHPGRIDDQLAATAELRDAGSVLRRAEMLQWSALLRAQQGRLDEAMGLADRASAIWQELGVGIWSVIGHPLFVGNMLLVAGRAAEGIELLRSALDPELVWRGARERALAGLGRGREALALAREMAEVAAHVDVAEYRFDVAIDMAEAERAAGNADAARGWLEQALAGAEARGAHAFVEQAQAALDQLEAG